MLTTPCHLPQNGAKTGKTHFLPAMESWAPLPNHIQRNSYGNRLNAFEGWNQHGTDPGNSLK